MEGFMLQLWDLYSKQLSFYYLAIEKGKILLLYFLSEMNVLFFSLNNLFKMV